MREYLEEIRSRSNGNVEVRFIDPEPFSEAEDEARAARNKTADHAAEAAGRTLWDVRVDLGAGFAARFAMEGQLMPLAKEETAALHRASAYLARAHA